MSLVFYDTETTGSSTSFDQILQFAGIRTDNELNEIERFDIRCRIHAHIVPAPGAMRVTGIRAAQLTDPSHPSHYEMVRAVRSKLLSWSPAIFIGYNSHRFDEHLLRQALYQTLHPPYLTNTHGNARSDVMRMLQAASLFAPNGFTVPLDEQGNRVFRLDRIAPANGFSHANAHDALADVEATIHLCRLLLERAPEVWSSFMRFSHKAAVVDYLETERVVCLADFYFSKPYCWLVTALGSSATNGSVRYVYDLSIDPRTLIGLSDAQLVSRLRRSPKPVRRVKCNGSPMLMPADDAPEIATSKALGIDEIERRADDLESIDGLRERLIATFESMQDEIDRSEHVEEQIYDGFPSLADQLLMDEFHRVPWEQRPNLVEQFEDRRLTQLGRRLVYLERPDLLDEALRLEHDVLMARRVVSDDQGVRWFTLPRALRELDDLIATAGASDQPFLREHRDFLAQRMSWVTDLIG